jgi:hypothetical protein
MWTSFNHFMNAVFDIYLWPFRNLPVAVQVLALAVPATIMALLAFRYTSDQAGITRTKNLIKAHLLELRLFKDDFRVMLRSQRRILLNSLRYARFGIVPMLVMIVPFLIIVVQVESLFAYNAMRPGESVILTVDVDGTTPVSELVTDLVLPPEINSETPALRVDSSGEVYWRLSARRTGRHQIGIRLGDEIILKQLVAGLSASRISPVVYRGNDWRALAWPGGMSLATNTMAESVRVSYPRGRIEFAGLSSASWLLVGQCLVLGFLLRRFFNVTF